VLIDIATYLREDGAMHAATSRPAIGRAVYSLRLRSVVPRAGDSSKRSRSRDGNLTVALFPPSATVHPTARFSTHR
jgi:hypothetical protein